MDVFQELQQVEGVSIHQMDSDGEVRLVLHVREIKTKWLKKKTKLKFILNSENWILIFFFHVTDTLRLTTSLSLFDTKLILLTVMEI